MQAHIILLPGDGIGPEIIEQAERVLQVSAQKHHHTFHFTRRLVGAAAMDADGTPLADETLEACRRSDAVLFGAVGDPRYDDPHAPVRPEQGLLRLRKGLGVFANLRPVRVHPALAEHSPLKAEVISHVDLLVVRELTGGLYFGRPQERTPTEQGLRAVDTLVYYDYEIRRVVELAFRLALQRRKKVTSVDKANVLESSRLWRQVTQETAARFPEVKVEHMLVDTAAMRLLSRPADFDVIVTENMFGDILTDEAAVLGGSMGMLPSASLGADGPGLYEPIHGSAPDIAGRGIANPVGTLLSAAMLLRHSLHLETEAQEIERAVEGAIADGCRTSDLGGSLTTRHMADEVINRMK